MKRPHPAREAPRRALDGKDRLVLEFTADHADATIQTLHESLSAKGLDPGDFRVTILELAAAGLLALPSTDAASRTDTHLDLTPPGRIALRAARRTEMLSVRLPDSLSRELLEFCRQEGLSRSECTPDLLRESLRTRRFPGIDFRGRAPHRVAYVTGTRLTPWWMHRIWLDHGKSEARVRENYPHLTVAQIRAGVGYAREFPADAPSEPLPPAWIPSVTFRG